MVIFFQLVIVLIKDTKEDLYKRGDWRASLINNLLLTKIPRHLTLNFIK